VGNVLGGECRADDKVFYFQKHLVIFLITRYYRAKLVFMETNYELLARH
jgi:hypothetical protein